MFHFRVSPYINEQTVSIGFILSMEAIVLSKLVSDTMLTISEIASFSSSDHCLPIYFLSSLISVGFSTGMFGAELRDFAEYAGFDITDPQKHILGLCIGIAVTSSNLALRVVMNTVPTHHCKYTADALKDIFSDFYFDESSDDDEDDFW